MNCDSIHKKFYADFYGCDRRQALLFRKAPGCLQVTFKAKKTLFKCGMAKSKNLDYADIVRLSLLLFMIYFDTLINLRGDIV